MNEVFYSEVDEHVKVSWILHQSIASILSFVSYGFLTINQSKICYSEHIALFSTAHFQIHLFHMYHSLLLYSMNLFIIVSLVSLGSYCCLLIDVNNKSYGRVQLLHSHTFYTRPNVDQIIAHVL